MINTRQGNKRIDGSTSNLLETNWFVNPQARKIFNDILIEEMFFEMLGIDKFVSFSKPIFEDLVLEFYTNFSANYNYHSLVVINYIVHGKHIAFDVVKFASENDSTDEEINDNLNELVFRDFLKTQAVVDVSLDKFENNNFGLNIRLLHDAITRSLMPKVNAQQKLVNIDMEIIYQFIIDHQVNFDRVVMKCFVEKRSIFHKKVYVRKDRQRKSGMPFGSILTGIFKDAGIDLSGLNRVEIPNGNMVHEGNIRSMKYVQT
ncbi:hypothetical protein OROGR_017193 [Orobanche gracilis]